MKMKSRRSRSAARRSGSGRKRKATDRNDARETSKSVSVSHVPAEPRVGAKAAVAPTCDMASTEEVTDDVDFPEAVVLIGKTHWRCVTCMVLLPRVSSIDEHLNTHHKCVDSPPTVSSASKREEGRGVIDTRDESHVPKATELENKQVLRSSLQSMEDAESGRIACEKETGLSSIRAGQEEWERNVRGGSRRERVGGGHERGKKFSKPLTSEDSDTEVESQGSGSPVKVSPGKGENEMSVLLARDLQESTGAVQLQSDAMTDGVSSPPNKKARGAENYVSCDTASMYEPSVENIPFSAEHVSTDTLKDLMKEKYVVFVGKGGTIDYSIDSEGNIDNDPPLPIETPSLQADAFLPPATPFLPDIHGPPETPIPPETPHPSEVTQQSDPFHPSEASSVDCQEPTQSELLSPVTADSVAAAIASEHLSRTEEGARVEQPLTSGHHFSSDGLMPNKPSDRDFASSATVCVTCGAAFDSPEELRHHREEMVKFDIVSCNSCGDKFHGLHQLNIHVFTTHEKFAKKFCFLCDVDCLDGFELQEHLLEHTYVETDGEEDANDLESLQHTCKTCGMEVEGNLSDLMNHYHTTHDQFVCAKCYELFTDLTEYEDHKMLHCSHADCAVVYSCPVSDCFQLCEDKEALMDHISWHEDRDMDEEHQSLLQCHYCSDHFRNPTSLQRHLADTHNEPDLRPFVCELCREAFGHSLELHQHNAIRHAGVKRYGCAYCDRHFAFRSAHRRHVASEHDVAATVLRM